MSPVCYILFWIFTYLTNEINVNNSVLPRLSFLQIEYDFCCYMVDATKPLFIVMLDTVMVLSFMKTSNIGKSDVFIGVYTV